MCAYTGVPGTYFLHKRIELCENALAIVPNILPIERGSICLKSKVARLLSDQIAAMEPFSGSGDYWGTQIGVPGTYFLHERIELCENELTIVPNICL